MYNLSKSDKTKRNEKKMFYVKINRTQPKYNEMKQPVCDVK